MERPVGRVVLLLLAACSSARAPVAAKDGAWDPGSETHRYTCPGPPLAFEEDEHLPLACAEGDSIACLTLSRSPRASAGDKVLLLHRLEQRCAQESCACWAYGEALAADAASDPAQTIEVIRAACVSGIENACARLSDITRACAWGDDRSARCGVLRRAGRIPAWMRPPPVGAASLPPELAGCFRVSKMIEGTSAPRDSGAEEPASDEAEPPDTSPQGICAIDPASCRDVHPPNPKHLVDLCAIAPDACPRDAHAMSIHALCKIAPAAMRVCGPPRSTPPRIAEDATYCFQSDLLVIGSPRRTPTRTTTMWFADLDTPSLFVSPLGFALRVTPDGVILERAAGRALLVREPASAAP